MKYLTLVLMALAMVASSTEVAAKASLAVNDEKSLTRMRRLLETASFPEKERVKERVKEKERCVEMWR